MCGAATGYVLELAAYPLARWAGQPNLYVVLPLAVLLLLGIRSTRREQPARVCLGAAARWSYAGVVGYLVVWLAAVVWARTSMSRFWPSDEDETFNLSLVGELRHHFPPQYPFTDAGALTYQWFVHAHMAASTWLTGLEPLMVYRRFDVLVLSVLAVLSAGVLTMRLSGRVWPGAVASGLLVLVGSFDLSGAVRGEAAPEERFLDGGLLLNSPTQTFAFALLPTVVILCLEILGERRPHAREWTALVVGTLALSGAKATAVPVLLAGFVAATLISFWRRKSVPWRALGGASVCAAALMLSAGVLYGGDSYSLRFDPGQTTTFFMTRLGVGGHGTVVIGVVTVSLLLMWLVSAAGAVGLLVSARLRWDSRVWWLTGAAASGLGATFMLAHEGMSQLYFGRTVAPLLAVMCAWGLAEIFPRGTGVREARRALVIAMVAGFSLLAVRAVTESLRVTREVEGRSVSEPLLRLWINLPALLLVVLAFAVVRVVVRDLSKGAVVLRGRTLVVFLVGLGLARSLAFVVGHYPDADVTEANAGIPPGGLAAARWLRQHSEPGDRAATNAHCLPAKTAAVCDSRHFWMSAFSERRFVLEGWAYTRYQEDWTAGYWGPAATLHANDQIFAAPTSHVAVRFLEAENVRWLLVDEQEPADLRGLAEAPGLRQHFSSGNFEVFEVLGGSQGHEVGVAEYSP